MHLSRLFNSMKHLSLVWTDRFPTNLGSSPFCHSSAISFHDLTVKNIPNNRSSTIGRLIDHIELSVTGQIPSSEWRRVDRTPSIIQMDPGIILALMPFQWLRQRDFTQPRCNQFLLRMVCQMSIHAGLTMCYQHEPANSCGVLLIRYTRYIGYKGDVSLSLNANVFCL